MSGVRHASVASRRRAARMSPNVGGRAAMEASGLLPVAVHKLHSWTPVKQAGGLIMSLLVQSEGGRSADRMSRRAQLVKVIAKGILGLPSERVARVGVDGVDGAGKTMFAD